MKQYANVDYDSNRRLGHQLVQYFDDRSVKEHLPNRCFRNGVIRPKKPGSASNNDCLQSCKRDGCKRICRRVP